MRSLVDQLGRSGRFSFSIAANPPLIQRITTWSTVQAISFLLLSFAAPHLGPPEYSIAISVALGAMSTRLRMLPYALPVVAVTLSGTAFAIASGVSGLAASGLITGLCLGLLECGRQEKWRVANTSLVGGIAVPLAYHFAAGVASYVPSELTTPISILIFSVLSTLPVIATQVEWRVVHRIPTRQQIGTVLKEAYRIAPLKASEMMGDLEQTCPDRHTREGLGEVAAWVYRLSLNLQMLDGELEKIPLDQLNARIAAAEKAARETEDPYTRDRRLATLRRLQALKMHREALALERQRTESLIDYALATLEEARTSLITSQHLPGHTMPEGIDEVLSRLRSHAAQQTARRDTAREFEQTP